MKTRRIALTVLSLLLVITLLLVMVVAPVAADSGIVTETGPPIIATDTQFLTAAESPLLIRSEASMVTVPDPGIVEASPSAQSDRSGHSGAALPWHGWTGIAIVTLLSLLGVACWQREKLTRAQARCHHLYGRFADRWPKIDVDNATFRGNIEGAGTSFALTR